MSKVKTKFTSVEEYLASFPENIKVRLLEIREAIKKTVPEADEVISYNIPAFKLKTVLVWYAGYKKHIGFYPVGEGSEAFGEELSAYKLSKGTVRFPLDQPIPADLVREIVKYRKKEEDEKLLLKSKTR